MSILISVEGLDGTGKSTLVKTLHNEMSNDSEFYPWVYATKEPGSIWSGKVASNIRQMVLETPDLRPLERELMFYIDASMHQRFINNQGQAIIISDRGLWSHLAYLYGYLKTKQIDYDDYLICKKLIAKVCAIPDCVIYLKGSLSLMKERLFGKAPDAIERNGDEFFEAVLNCYEDLLKERQDEGKPVVILEASDNLNKNIIKVVEYLKGVFTDEQLRQGNK